VQIRIKIIYDNNIKSFSKCDNSIYRGTSKVNSPQRRIPQIAAQVFLHEYGITRSKEEERRDLSMLRPAVKLQEKNGSNLGWETKHSDKISWFWALSPGECRDRASNWITAAFSQLLSNSLLLFCTRIAWQCCPTFLCTRAQFTDAYGDAGATTLLLLLLIIIIINQ
jgi:hypothetical protein